METLLYTCGCLYCLIIVLNFPLTSFATAPTSQELQNNSLCVHMMDTTSYEWGTLQGDFKQGASLAATIHCWGDPSKCYIAGNNSVFFGSSQVEILSNQAIPGVITVVTFALKIPSYVTPVSPPLLVPFYYLANMSTSLSSQIEPATGKSISVCMVTASIPNNSATSSSAIVASSTTSSSALASSSSNANSAMASISTTTVPNTSVIDDLYESDIYDMSTDVMYSMYDSSNIPIIMTTTITATTTVYISLTSTSSTTQTSSVLSSSTQSSQVPTEDPVVTVSEKVIRANTVLVTIGLTTVEHWNNDLNLRLAFVSAIATEATLYCAENLQECLLQQRTTFSSSDVKLQEGYPVAVSSSSVKLSVALYLPPSAMLVSEANEPIIPRAALIATILKAATPFYLQTGRPILEIEAPTNKETSSNTGVVAGTTIPFLLLILAGVAIIVLFVVIHVHRKRKKEFKNAQLPDGQLTGQGAVDLLSYKIVEDEQ